MHDMTAPEIQTTRHLNRFTMALAKGPTKQEPEIQHRNWKYKTGNTVSTTQEPETQNNIGTGNTVSTIQELEM